MIKYPTLLMALVAGLLTASCSTDDDFVRAHRVRTFNEAASVNIAALGAANFTGLAKGLRPRFNLSASEALKAAAPTTTFVEEQLLNAIITSIAVAPPRSGTIGTTKTTSDGATTTVNVNIESKTEPGKAQPVDLSKAPTLGDRAKPNLKTDRDKALPIDPVLQYSVAAALFQYVQLLDAAVDAVASRTDVVPIVVPIAVNVRPYARNQPYDVYVTVTFFAEALENPEQFSGGVCPPRRGAVPAPARSYPLFVVPLLASDNLERTQTSRAVQMLSQFALALNALMRGFALDASFVRSRDEMRNTLGTEFNSLMTVGRVMDNSLSIRIGAPFSPTAGFSMVPRNNTVYALVLAPKQLMDGNNGTLRIISRSSLRDAQSGKPLPFDAGVKERAYKDLVERTVPSAACRAALMPSRGSVDERLAKLEILRSFANRQDIGGATTFLERECGPARSSDTSTINYYALPLLAGMADVQGGSDVQSAALPLGSCLGLNPRGR